MLQGPAIPAFVGRATDVLVALRRLRAASLLVDVGSEFPHAQ